METFFDSRLDLLQRQIQKHSDRLKFKAEEALKKRVQSSDVLAENFDREVKNFKLKVCTDIVLFTAIAIATERVKCRFLGVCRLWLHRGIPRRW